MACTIIYKSDVDPIDVFRSWLLERQVHPDDDIRTANFAVLSTINTANKIPKPSSRVISIADLNSNGQFVFTTTLTSSKSQQLILNPSCNITYNWSILRKQVRIDGIAKIADDFTSNQLWSNKDRSYWIWACSTSQTNEIDNINVLKDKMQKTAEKYEYSQIIPRPSNWTAWLIDPLEIEFWRGHNEGLHLRQRYTKQSIDDESWSFANIEP